MKGILAVVLMLPLCGGLLAGKKDDVLNDGVMFANSLWTEVLGKPKLKYKKITADQLGTLYGSWKGARLGPCENPEILLVLKKDGTWERQQLGPDLDENEVARSRKSAHWYLKEGMILLFGTKITEKSAFEAENFGSALTLEGDKLRLIDVLMQQGFVELTKMNAAEQGDGPKR